VGKIEILPDGLDPERRFQAPASLIGIMLVVR